MEKEIYYTIQNKKQTKYSTLDEVQKICEKQAENNLIIEKHISIIEEIPYTVKRKNNDINLIKEFIIKLKSKLCNPEINLFKNYDNFCIGFVKEYFFKYAYKIGKIENYNWNSHSDEEYKILSEILQKYIYDLFENYPIDKIQINMLKTNYKPCNGIQIFFEKTLDYVKSGISEKSGINIFEHDLFPNSFCIQLRGDSKEKSISVDYWDGNHGRHVYDYGYEFVDLSDKKIQKYIDKVLNILC